MLFTVFDTSPHLFLRLFYLPINNFSFFVFTFFISNTINIIYVFKTTTCLMSDYVMKCLVGSVYSEPNWSYFWIKSSIECSMCSLSLLPGKFSNWLGFMTSSLCTTKTANRIVFIESWQINFVLWFSYISNVGTSSCESDSFLTISPYFVLLSPEFLIVELVLAFCLFGKTLSPFCLSVYTLFLIGSKEFFTHSLVVISWCLTPFSLSSFPPLVIPLSTHQINCLSQLLFLDVLLFIHHHSRHILSLCF